MITSALLKNRIEKFWGYGSLESPVWLVGIEERFDNKNLSLDILEKQFIYTKENMKNGMLSANRSNISEWKHLPNMGPFLLDGKLQRTWLLPITLYLYLRNKTKPSKESILDFQRNVLADGKKKEVATLELSPLPAFSTSDWFYEKYGIPELKSRNKYQMYYLPKRAEKLKELIKEHKPKLVIFYSANKTVHLPRWKEVIGLELEEMTDSKQRLTMYFAKNSDTSFCIIPQPASGVSYEDLYDYADTIKRRVTL